MNRRIILSITPALSLLLSLVGLPSTAQGQQRQRFAARSGVVTPAIGQTLRVTVVPTGSDPIRVRFEWTQYMAAGCSGMPPVCRHTVASQGSTAVHTLNGDMAPEEALLLDVPGTGEGVNVTVRSNSRDARVVFIVFDTSTQRIVACVEDRWDWGPGG